MTREGLDALQEHRVFWVPTAGALMRAADQPDIAPETKAFVQRTVDGHLAMLLSACERGIHLAIGTDCALPDPNYRKAYEAELGFFLQAGIPAADVDRIARDGGMELLGLKQPRMDAHRHK
jgi:hypothetical protein